MKFSIKRLCALVGVASVIGVFLGVTQPHAQPSAAPTRTTRVIIYPSANETIDQLKNQGIDEVDSYGSYWVAKANGAQISMLKRTRPGRVADADDLNRIELNAMTIDTSASAPVVPSQLQQPDFGGKRLKLIQFKGPIKSAWLAQVKAIKNVRVVSYVPQNAYILWLDAGAVTKLQNLLEPQGPIQWIGAYHPYYKIPQDLLAADGTESVEIRVAMVDDPQEPPAASTLEAFGSIKSSLSRLGEEIVQMVVPPPAVLPIAQLPGVLWIEKVQPKKMLDEVQDLVLAEQTNQPPFFSPTPPPPVSTGIHYLAFLTNAVGGGLSSFRDPNTYPVVDVADTGLDNGTGRPFHPAFYNLGNTNSFSRIVYTKPPWLAGDPLTQLGCTTRIVPADRGAFRTLEAADLDGHGTFVASVLAGYDAGTNILNRQYLSLLTINSNLAVNVSCPGSGTTNVTVSLDVGVTDICSSVHVFSNATWSLTAGSCSSPSNVVVAYTVVATNTNSEVRVDSDGFQYGMGVSPFGLIGVTRVWGTMESSVFSLTTENNVCIPVFHATSFCVNDLPGIIASAYGSFARIENNSWADVLGLHAENGGLYTSDSQTYDIAVRDAILPPTANGTPGPSPLNQEFAVVFACNSLLGDAGQQGNVGGFADMRVTAPATAKNVISVGAAVNPETDCDGSSSLDMYNRSAAGPTVDGRFKPEIVAPGASVVVAENELQPSLEHPASGLSPTNCDVEELVPLAPDILKTIGPSCTSTGILDINLYACVSGSSYAAPAVSGAIQLLWWYFQNRLTDETGNPLLQPSPAMAKAYLLNAARYLPITNPQTGTMDTLPSIIQGMGELDLFRMFDGTARFIRDESSPRAIDPPLITTNPAPQQTYFSQSGQSYEVTGTVASNGSPFRVTLAWTDAPGDPSASAELVNDLDLEVTIGGQTYRGNVFSEDHSVVGGARDNVNNTESVFLPASAVSAGDAFKVVVRAANIAGDGVPNVGGDLDQDFALVVYNGANPSDAPNLATNDACQTAIDITQFPFSFTNTLTKTLYHNVHPSPTAARGGADEFFRIVLPTPGTTFTVDTFGSSFDTVLSVWQVREIPQSVYVRGDCGALTELISNNDAGTGLQSRVSFTADGSNTYFIVVEPHNDGPGGTMVLNVRPTNPPVTVTPTSLAFGNQIQGTTSAVQTVTYANGASVPVQVDTVSITGDDPSDFVLVSQSCEGNALATGTNCTASVAFVPQTDGARQANLTFIDDAVGSPRTVRLTGTGLPPTGLVCVNPASISFGNVGVGVTSTPQSVTISNCGVASLNVTGVGISGANASNFKVVANTCGSLSPNDTCTVSVVFSPGAVGAYSATLAISNDVGSPEPVSLTGTGSLIFSQPDAAIGKTVNYKKMVGLNIFDSLGTNERTVRQIHPGQKCKFFVAVKNAGSDPDQFKIDADPSPSGFTVKYFLGAKPAFSTEVSDAATNATLATATMAAGAHTGDATMMRVVVKADKHVPRGTVATFVIRFTSATDPTKVDAVQAVVLTK